MKTKIVLVIAMMMFLVSSLCIMPAFTQPPSGAVSHWKFDEDSGTTAYDSIGTNDGTLKNGPVWTMGKVAGALSFDGSNDYVEVPHTAELDITDDLSVEFWFNTDTIDRDGLVSKYWDTGMADRCWMIYLPKEAISCDNLDLPTDRCIPILTVYDILPQMDSIGQPPPMP